MGIVDHVLHVDGDFLIISLSVFQCILSSSLIQQLIDLTLFFFTFAFRHVFQGYLERFGFMNESHKSKASLMSQESLSEAIREYQRFAQINETGECSLLLLFASSSQDRCSDARIFFTPFSLLSLIQIINLCVFHPMDSCLTYVSVYITSIQPVKKHILQLPLSLHTSLTWLVP